MTGTRKNWLWGCGAGCLGVILVTSGLVGGGAWLLKSSLGDWREANETQDALHAALGEVDDFVPDAAGELDPRRVVVFLEVQARTEAVRLELVHDLRAARLELEGARGEFGRVVRAIKHGANIAPQYAGFTRIRAQTLLDVGMNPGEYLYLHSLVYHCWLGHDPAAGVDELSLAMARRNDGGFQIRIGDDHGSDGDPEDLARQLRRQLQDRHRGWLQEMLREAPASSGPAAEAWRDALRGELDLLASSTEAMPWTRSFPASWDEVLAPYHAALVAGWSDEGNLLELFGLD